MLFFNIVVFCMSWDRKPTWTRRVALKHTQTHTHSKPSKRTKSDHHVCALSDLCVHYVKVSISQHLSDIKGAWCTQWCMWDIAGKWVGFPAWLSKFWLWSRAILETVGFPSSHSFAVMKEPSYSNKQALLRCTSTTSLIQEVSPISPQMAPAVRRGTPPRHSSPQLQHGEQVVGYVVGLEW